jgi:hypothetical protein
MPDPAAPAALPYQTPPPTSPTGVAIIPARVVPYILALLAIVGALIGLGMGTPPALPVLVPAVPYLQAGSVVLLALLGATPGLRRAAVVVLCVASVSLLAACPHPTPIQRQAITCATDIGSAELAHAPQIVAAIGSQDWLSALEQILSAAGPGILCEAQTLLSFIKGQEVSPIATSKAVAALGGGGPAYEGAARLEAWLRTHRSDYK